GDFAEPTNCAVARVVLVTAVSRGRGTNVGARVQRRRGIWTDRQRSSTMVHRTRLGLVGVVLVAGALGCGGSAPREEAQSESSAVSASSANESIIYNPQATVFGKRYSDWAGAWWQWVYAVPGTHHPLLDTTGEHCALGQSGEVFYLGGTFGGDATRRCRVPKGKALFFPLIN